MFYNCTKIAGHIPPKLFDSCRTALTRVNSMFAGCTNLNYVKCLATTGMMDGLSSLTGTRNWMINVASTGTFIKAAGVEWPSGSYGIPKGWTVKIDGQYTITFANWDGTILQTIQVEEGQTPVYTGETPTRPSDEQYNYTFNGWSPTITEAIQDITYTAQYTEEIIEEPTSDVPQYLRFGCSNESGSATIKVPSVSLYPDLQYRLVKDNIEGEW